ncbi:hypothetical protein SNEBB_010099 [Seison nebaliae]|nr:hypothetical protein SNEBB_010099 [Seison nebaliae]
MSRNISDVAVNQMTTNSKIKKRFFSTKPSKNIRIKENSKTRKDHHSSTEAVHHKKEAPRKPKPKSEHGKQHKSHGKRKNYEREHSAVKEQIDFMVDDIRQITKDRAQTSSRTKDHKTNHGRYEEKSNRNPEPSPPEPFDPKFQNLFSITRSSRVSGRFPELQSQPDEAPVSRRSYVRRKVSNRPKTAKFTRTQNRRQSQMSETKR